MTPREPVTPRTSAIDEDDRGSTLPLILGFFLIALLMVAAATALGQAFVQQRDLQDICDGAVAAAAASAGDLDRSDGAAAGDSLRFSGVATVVRAYLARDPDRSDVRVRTALSRDHERITLRCTQTRTLALGKPFGRGHLTHVATSSARAAVLG